MISLSRAARVPGQGLSPDALLSHFACMSFVAVPCRGGAVLGRAVGDGMASGFSDSGLSVIAPPVLCNVSPVLMLWRTTEPLDGACIAARVGNSARSVSGSLSRTRAVMVVDVVVTLVAVASVSQPCAPRAVCAGVCAGPCGCSCRCCGAVAGALPCEGRINCIDIRLTACGTADGSCGYGALPLVRAWEGAPEVLDTAASALLARTLCPGRRACSVGGRMVVICVLSVPGLLGRRLGSAVGEICRTCLPPGLSWLLSAPPWKVTRRAAERAVRLWLRVPADPLDLRRGVGV